MNLGRNQRPAIRFGSAAPNSVRLPNPHRKFDAICLNRTHLANSLGANLTSLPFILAFEGAWRKEEVGMISPTQAYHLPVLRCHRYSSSTAYKRARETYQD